MLQFREHLVQSLRAAWPNIVFNAPLATALPTTLNFSVPGVPSGVVVDLLDAAGVRVSAGSACSAQSVAPSYVLQAMGLPDWQAASAVRLSFGAMADAAFIDAACARIERCGQAWHAAPARAAAPVEAWPPQVGPALPDDPAMQLAADMLEGFLRDHPEALLVDVREAYEHQADEQPLRFGRPVRSAPLDSLAAQLADCWEQPHRPLVLFCRSGKRSARAVQRLRQLGYGQVWQLVGGLAINCVAARAR